MANERELKLKLTGDASQAEKAVARLEAALKKAEAELAKAKETTDKVDDSVEHLGSKTDHTGARLAGLGDAARNAAVQHLGPLGEAADMAGLDLEKMDTKALAAGAGLVAVAGFAAQGVQKFSALADEVRKVHDVSGLTFEDSSRLVAVSDDLGISADTAASSMGRLAKNIDAGKLEEYGIQVVRAKDGTVDMAATLGNVADAMNRTTDPTKRAAMGTALFGKSWADLAPVLQLGRKGIEDAFASVSDGQIVTENNADAVREWQMALDDAQDSVTEIQMAIGKQLLPTLSLMAKDFATATNAVGKLTGGSASFLDVLTPLSTSMGLYNLRTKQQQEENEKAARSMTGLAGAAAESAVRAAEAGRANQDLAEKEQAAAAQADILKARHQDVAQAAKDAAAATAEQKRQLDLLNGVTQSIVGAQLSAMQAANAFTDAQNDLAVKQRDVTDAINEFGANSPQAQVAANDYARTLVNAQQSADSLAKATVEQARQQALAAGQSFTDAQSVLVYRDSLVNTRDATNDPKLKTGLDQLIALVDDSARAAGDAERKFYDAEAAARRLAAAASGALQTTNQGTIVGSADSTDRRLATQSAGPASTSVTNNVTVNASTPANPWSIAQDVDWALRTAGR